MNGLAFSSVDLGELRRQLQSWRRRRRGRARLPDEVWAAAASLARSEGVSRVSRSLHLDYHRLRRRCALPDLPGRAPALVPTFVEVHCEPAPERRAPAFRVELVGAGDARMRLELGQDVSAVVAVAEAFWRRIP